MAQPWEPEIEFTREQARALIEAQFPELGPLQLADYGKGWDNLAYLVNDAWVFRFPQRELAGECMTGELAALRHLPRPLLLEAPVATFVGAPSGDYPYAFVGYRELAGRTACSVELSDDARARSAPKLGAFLVALHGTPITDEMQREVHGDRIRRADLAYRAGQLEARLDELEALGVGQAPTAPGRSSAEAGVPEGSSRDEHATDVSEVDVAAVRALARDLAQAPAWPHAPRLVHGDLYARHVLLDDKLTACGVIDWGDAHLGDPALDLSIAFAFLPKPARAGFFAAYGNVDEGTLRRARFRAFLSGAALVHYGASVGDAPLLRAGLFAFESALD